jgi:transposase
MRDITEWYTMKERYRNGVSISQIAREEGLDRKTVRKLVRAQSPPKYERQPSGQSKLDPYKQYIRDRLKQYPLKARKVFEEIQEQGFTGSYSLVKRFTRPIRNDRAIPAEMRFETPPGKQGQADWKKAGKIEIDGVVKTLWCFVMILGFSRMRFITYTTDTKTETFIRCHLEAFRYFGGYPEEMLYDNTKNVVLDRALRASDSKWNPLFEDFFRHHCFIPRLCKPGIGGAKTKGKAEKLCQYSDSNFFIGLEFSSIQELNARAIKWCNKVNNEVHQTTYEIPLEKLKQEPLNHLETMAPYQIVIHETRKISRDSFISYRGNKYSIPWKYAGREARILIKESKMDVEIDAEVICTHEILPGSHRVIKVKEHFEGLYKEILDRNKTQHIRRLSGHVSRKDTVKVSFKLTNYPDMMVQERDLKVYDTLADTCGGGGNE